MMVDVNSSKSGDHFLCINVSLVSWKTDYVVFLWIFLDQILHLSYSKLFCFMCPMWMILDVGTATRWQHGCSLSVIHLMTNRGIYAEETTSHRRVYGWRWTLPCILRIFIAWQLLLCGLTMLMLLNWMIAIYWYHRLLWPYNCVLCISCVIQSSSIIHIPFSVLYSRHLRKAVVTHRPV